VTTSQVERTIADRLLDAASRLWPDQPVTVGEPLLGSRELVFVPHARSPRALVPAGHRSAAAGSVRRFSHVLTTRERASRLAVSAALRVGGERLLPDRVRIHPVTAGHPDSIETRLSDLLGREVVVAVTVGSARVNQKPVLAVHDCRGRPVAFVKVGDTPLTVGLVRREAAALVRLAPRVPDPLEIPRLIHIGRWRGLELMVVSALDTVARPSHRPVLRPPTAAMAALAASFDGGTQPLGRTRFWRDLVDVATSLGDTTARDRYIGALAEISAQHADHPVRLGAWHGDWTPWNMAWRHDRLQLWDWEQFAVGVPRGLDRVHYVLNTVARRTAFRPGWVEAALRTRAVRQEHLLVVLYLAAITARYLRGCETADGDILRDTGSAVLDALTDRTGAGR
jgi:hypothetical protein